MDKLKSINWIITSKCNSRCSHCDIWRNKNNKDMSLDSIRRFLEDDTIKESYKYYGKEFDISLGGGEPFLRQDLQDIVEIIEEKCPGSFKTISTNGLKTKEILKFVKNNQNLDFKLNVSVDGLREVHDKIRGFEGAFKKTISTIKYIKKYFPKQNIEMSMTLMPQNYNQILKVYRLSEKLGCDFSFKPAENMANYTNSINKKEFIFTKEQLCIIRNQCFKISDAMYEKKKYAKSKFYNDIPFYLAGKKKPKTCSVFNKHLTIMPQGESYFCIKENSIGNILNHKVSDLFYELDEKFECESCMLMCGSYKDYANAYYKNRTANIETTYRCNLDCDMCTQKELRKNNNEDMKINTFRNIINENEDISHVSFVGGEPFIHPDFFEMMDFLDRRGITYEITTNGCFIGENVLEELKHYIGLRRINLSLEEMEIFHRQSNEKNTYNKNLINLKKANELFNTNISFFLRRDNIQKIPGKIESLAKKGIKNYKIIYGRTMFKKQLEYIKIYKIFKKLDDLFIRYNIKISYEPKLFKKNLMDFLNGKYEDNFEQYIFTPNGERFLREFIRGRNRQERTIIFKNSNHDCRIKETNIEEEKSIIKEKYGLEIHNPVKIKTQENKVIKFNDEKQNKYLAKFFFSFSDDYMETFLLKNKQLKKDGISINNPVKNKFNAYLSKKKQEHLVLYELAEGYQRIDGFSEKLLERSLLLLTRVHNSLTKINCNTKTNMAGRKFYFSEKKRNLLQTIYYLNMFSQDEMKMIKRILNKHLYFFTICDKHLIHGDFGPHNLLRKGNNLLIFDFEETRIEPRSVDIAKIFGVYLSQSPEKPKNFYQFYELLKKVVRIYNNNIEIKLKNKDISLLLTTCVKKMITDIYKNKENLKNEQNNNNMIRNYIRYIYHGLKTEHLKNSIQDF